jgi:endoglucanase
MFLTATWPRSSTGPDGSGDWVGLDFGAGVSNVITQINYCPRSGFESRMIAGIFQGANQAASATRSRWPPWGRNRPRASSRRRTSADTSAFRYVRYLSPNPAVLATWPSCSFMAMC